MMISIVRFIMIWVRWFNVSEGVNVRPPFPAIQTFNRLREGFGGELLRNDSVRVAVSANTAAKLMNAAGPLCERWSRGSAFWRPAESWDLAPLGIGRSLAITDHAFCFRMRRQVRHGTGQACFAQASAATPFPGQDGAAIHAAACQNPYSWGRFATDRAGIV